MVATFLSVEDDLDSPSVSLRHIEQASTLLPCLRLRHTGSDQCILTKPDQLVAGSWDIRCVSTKVFADVPVHRVLTVAGTIRAYNRFTCYASEATHEVAHRRLDTTGVRSGD